MKTRIRILTALLTLALAACLGDTGNVDKDESTGAVSQPFSTVLPVADSQMNAIDLPASMSVPLSFTGTTNIYSQLQAIPPLRRQCVSNALTSMGLESYLDPATEPGSVPVFAEPPSLIEINCSGHLVTIAFRTKIGGSNDDGPVYAVTDAVVDLITDLWDLLCREIRCLQAVNGEHYTCGCKDSQLPSCDLCPPPEDLPPCCE